MKTDHIDDTDAVWRALANPVRRRILDLLVPGPVITGALAEAFPELSRFAVMQHLKVLEEAELVIPRREGRLRYNHLNAIPIQRIYRRWVSRYAGRWADSLLALKDELEEETGEEPETRSGTVA
ncbi:MAG TPA: metalloregulator ArsR/SmtB family transcription factor [Longimicrobiales bacterium]|nr:metalloregulator ArsR/SmtB family transcription factor [Longimicrobiales bacterium]